MKKKVDAFYNHPLFLLKLNVNIFLRGLERNVQDMSEKLLLLYKLSILCKQFFAIVTFC